VGASASFVVVVPLITKIIV